VERHSDVGKPGFDTIDAQRSARNALSGDVHVGVGTADHLRQKEDALHINVRRHLDAGRVLDVARQQRLGADPCHAVRAPEKQRNHADQTKRLKEKAPAFRR
jgi:hypothetical protein